MSERIIRYIVFVYNFSQWQRWLNSKLGKIYKNKKYVMRIQQMLKSELNLV